MSADRIDAVTALLIETGEAHGRYEESELNGLYDKEWARWYAAYAVEHGLGALIGRDVSAETLAEFLARTNVEFESADPKPTDTWAPYTARRILDEL